ncbi:MAG: clostripain-related cysteine peptidase [candidate division WOR-3 bacterium]
MVKRCILIFVAMCVVLFITDCGKEKKATWTIIAYMDGNNNLDISQNNTSFVISDAQEMETVGSSEDVEIIAMVSSLKKGGIAKYYHIEKFTNELPDSLSSPVLENLGTKDMSDKQTLKDFLVYARDKYPAEHYLLIVDDHGGGWRGSCSDEQNGAGGLMSMPDMKVALDTFKFDIICFHCCLMSMAEVAYELKERSDYLVASEFTMPMQSILGTSKWLSALVANPDITPEELSKSIVEGVYNTANEKQKICHMAACNLQLVSALGSKVSALGNNLVTETGSYWNEVLDAFNQTHYTEYDDPAFVDLREFAKKIQQEPNLKNINLIYNAAQEVIDAINSTVVMTMTNATGLTRGGLTIHLPYSTALFDSTNYVKISWASTNWHSFLSTFIASCGGGGGDLTVSGVVNWPGHSLSNYCIAFLDTSHTNTIWPVGIVSVNPSTGAYTISYPLSAPLEAYVEAFDDVNNNGYIDTGEGLGYWDANGNGNWDDMVTFQPGQTVNNANITLFTVSKRQGTAGWQRN